MSSRGWGVLLGAVLIVVLMVGAGSYFLYRGGQRAWDEARRAPEERERVIALERERANQERAERAERAELAAREQAADTQLPVAPPPHPVEARLPEPIVPPEPVVIEAPLR